jgi:hypothetical protein
MTEELSRVSATLPATADAADAAPGVGPGRYKRNQTSNAGHDEESCLADSDVIQAGVQKVEAVSQTWTKGSLYVAYLR